MERDNKHPNEFYIVLNLKEFATIEYIKDFLRLIITMDLSNQLKIILCPPVQFLGLFYNKILPKNTSIASQIVDCRNGTGQVRAVYLTELECKYVLCGHMEHGDVNKWEQAAEANENKLIPIVFIDKIPVKSESNPNYIYVYEPHDRIGAKDAMDEETIRNFAEDFKSQNPDSKLLYGGSVNISNLANIAEHVDGVCIGRASRDLNQVKEILKYCHERFKLVTE